MCVSGGRVLVFRKTLRMYWVDYFLYVALVSDLYSLKSENVLFIEYSKFLLRSNSNLLLHERHRTIFNYRRYCESISKSFCSENLQGYRTKGYLRIRDQWFSKFLSVYLCRCYRTDYWPNCFEKESPEPWSDCPFMKLNHRERPTKN